MKKLLSKALDRLTGDREGKAPDAPVALPGFAALSHAGEPRGPDDLRGRPTVIWFYPVADTAG